MPFCVNCGKQLVEGANFCAFCGSKVGMVSMQYSPAAEAETNVQRKQEYIGKVFKCPNCGEVISQSVARCPSCGCEISGKEANETVRQFSKQLMELERNREPENESTAQAVVNAFFGRVNGRRDKVDAQIVSLIRSFPVPNTIEEISEFMFLAFANIDVNLSKHTHSNSSYLAIQAGGGQRDISDAWVSKMQQVYAKAERTFPNDPAFAQIKDVYLLKMKELKIKVK